MVYGTTLDELMLDVQGMLLDFDMNASLKTLASAYGDRIKYVWGPPKEHAGMRAALIRPDGIVAWTSDSDPDCSELEKAAAQWFGQANLA
ncbi:hypothetical protein JI741_05550 [Chryseolinea sp. Jin1]|uniref:Alkyl hydroperoxide reductase subunit C/ Thiol specific antioxidant domain-containing protein n=2 Tax=Chryseolinea lacunae TaxID=2801331 RepID=A0ABS1KN50_9BACT|nr:hypothetical protein [Chryseolinea lacunae]